jgi:hypothetical protein
MDGFKAAEAACEKLRGYTKKKVDVDVFLPLRATAARRAEQLAATHAKNGRHFPHDNPSSTMFTLLDALGPEARGDDRTDDVGAVRAARHRAAQTGEPVVR